MNRVLYFLVAAAAVLPTCARATCGGLIDGTTAVVSGKRYSPFNATSVSDNYAIRISNTISKTCEFALVFSALPGPRQLGGTLAYTLTDLNGRSLMVADPPTAAPAFFLSASNVGPNVTTQLSFDVNIARGQFAAPAVYADKVTLRLYSVEEGRFELQDSKPLTLSYTVPEELSVTVGNAEPGGTVQFGELVQGEQRSLILRTRSNVSYRLNVSSDNRGVLLLDPPVSRKAWSVPYVTAIDDVVVDLSAPAGSPTVQVPPTAVAGDRHALLLTIGDASKKRAGLYRDVITVRIHSAQP